MPRTSIRRVQRQHGNAGHKACPARPSTAYSFTPRRGLPAWKARRRTLPAQGCLPPAQTAHHGRYFCHDDERLGHSLLRGQGKARHKQPQHHGHGTAQCQASAPRRPKAPAPAGSRAAQSEAPCKVHGVDRKAPLGHRFCSSAPGARPSTAPPSKSPGGQRRRAPYNALHEAHYLVALQRTQRGGQHKADKAPSVEATSSPAYAASCGVAASACAMAQPPISGASTRPAGSAASNGSGPPPRPAMPKGPRPPHCICRPWKGTEAPWRQARCGTPEPRPAFRPVPRPRRPAPQTAEKNGYGRVHFSQARRPLPARRSSGVRKASRLRLPWRDDRQPAKLFFIISESTSGRVWMGQ